MRVMALFSTSFFAKCLHVGEDGPGRGHLCHTDTILVISYFSMKMYIVGTQKHLCKVLQGASNEYSQNMFSWRNKKNYSNCLIGKSILSGALSQYLPLIFGHLNSLPYLS